jgi:SNF2 family DNA or RNA helicase
VCEVQKEIPLSEAEAKFYFKYLRRRGRRLIGDLAKNLVDEDDLDQACGHLSRFRQALLVVNGEASSKVRAACAAVAQRMREDPNAKILVFSNFVDAGVKIISRLLDELQVAHACFVGRSRDSQRKEMIENFRSGSLPVLVLSPVGFEGLDLAGTTDVFIVDPHYNPEVKAQLIARATRAGGALRQISVQSFIAVVRSENVETIDQVINRVAERKRAVNNAILEALCPVTPRIGEDPRMC